MSQAINAEELLKEVEIVKPKRLLGLRHVQFFMLFASLVVGYGIRTNMSVGIIAMMSDKPPNGDIPTYPNWTQKDTILSSFFWGYVVLQIAAGQLVKNYGPKWFFTAAMFLNALFSFLTPIMAASIGEAGVIICRVIQGLSQGFFYPSIHNLLGRWTPLPERSTVGSFVYTGGPLGTVISMPVTGFISASNVGWPTVFYLYGGLGLIWVAVWVWVGSDSPQIHRSISDEERTYIERTTGSSEKEEEIPTPWKSIFTSLPFIAIFVAHSGQNWGFFTLLTEIPSYMKNILGYDISENSLLSALPYFVCWLLSFFTSPLCDYLIVKKYLSIGAARKVFHTIGVVGPAIALTILSFVSADQKVLVLVLLVFAVALNAGTYCAFLVNHIDLSPNHSGILMGITNSLSNVFSIIAPLAVNLIGYEQTDPMLWKIVFWIASAIYVVTDIFYLIFASGEIQPWNEIPTEVDAELGEKKEAKQNNEQKFLPAEVDAELGEKKEAKRNDEQKS